MKILTVVGARPQFIKASAVSRAMLKRPQGCVSEVLVHTGQHYDQKMSQVFFEELGIGTPAYNLGIAGGSHGEMTGRMLEGLERVFLAERPDRVLIYGDTNSTLAGALAASKLHIPIAHVEAGLRSFNLRMPEEVNRIVADHLSCLLLCPTEAAVANLRREGLSERAHLVGDVMYDVALYYSRTADSRTNIHSRLGARPKEYVLATCHRAENTDEPQRLANIAKGLANIGAARTVIFPVHPRTKAKLADYGLLQQLAAAVTIIEPVSYLDMVVLEKHAELIITDSGGMQKEAFFYQVPCITIRDETEWVETVSLGWNTLVGADTEKMVEAAAQSKELNNRLSARPYGNGDAADRILDILLTP